MLNFIREIKNNILVYDGSKGFMLQRMGMEGGECPELWNVDHADKVKEIYKAYKDAGADVIQTNTFQGNSIVLEKYGLEGRAYELNYEGARLAKEVMGDNGFVAASIGPLGELMHPLGELTFDRAYEVFKEQIKAVADGGVDIINFETFTDLAEIRAALIAAKENFDLPVICSMAFEANGKTMMGNDPYTCATVLKSLGADMVGVNCSTGPEHLVAMVEKMSQAGGVYISAKPNAGIPELIEGKTVYASKPEDFSEFAKKCAKAGARLIGGCCGTTPEFISVIRKAVDTIEPSEVPVSTGKIITSAVKSLSINTVEKEEIPKIGIVRDSDVYNELIHGRTELLAEQVMDISGQNAQSVLVEINDMENIDILPEAVNVLQLYIKEPLIFNIEKPEILRAVLRNYRGKAGIVLPEARDANIEEMVSIARKYGSTILMHDEIMTRENL